VTAARQHLGTLPISNQPPYSLLNRQIEAEVLPVCEREGIGQLVFSPLAQGILTGKYAGGKIPPGSRLADPQRNVFMRELANPEVFARVDRFAGLARESRLTPAQAALAWCLRRWSIASVIVGATTPDQVEQNVKAAGIRLPEEILVRLDEIFPPPLPFPPP